ncbi:ammonium transporter [Desulfurobacterium atlanticum]|uniref:Ammonium transporter n=1 Tax=Desulfurobacterium atlanticum TaxID=240169 RepID=A0A238YEA2_9BACT|nr:ammonium transporter [Desulfurobacterium atlanticum]SNR69477.1 ammonium transporter [Desulfurobacterium atlanticum]
MATAELFQNVNALTGLVEALKNLSNALDVFYLVVMGALVFIMQWGFAMLEGGQARAKNANNVMMKNILDFMVGGVLWLFIGYCIVAYGSDFGQWGSWIKDIFSAEAGIANNGLGLAEWFFGLVFCATAATIISGGVAERINFTAYVILSILVTGLLYPIWVHIGPWGAGILPYHDYAGSLNVHALGGALGLGAIIALGPRIGRFKIKDGKRIPVPIPGHNVPMAIFGAFCLAFGWYGFNVGSSIYLKDISGLVAVTTTMAMCAGAISAMIVSKFDPLATANGFLAGLVAICSGTDVVSPFGAIVIGLIAGAQVPIVFSLLEKLGIDDACGIFPVHFGGGAVGAILAGVFGTKALGGLGDVNLIQQVIATVLCLVYGVIAGYIAAKVAGALGGGLRVPVEWEQEGLDITEHHLKAYHDEDPVSMAAYEKAKRGEVA